MLFMRVRPGRCIREKFPQKVIPEAFGGEGPGRWNHVAGICGWRKPVVVRGLKKASAARAQRREEEVEWKETEK